MRILGFVIHLKRATQRRAHVEMLLAGAPCKTVIFDAVDGQAMTEADFRSVLSEKPLLRPAYPFQVGRGEVACFLSHRAIWHQMVENGIDQALVLEDDVALGDDFKAAFDFASTFVGLDGFVQFQTRTIRDTAETVEQKDGLRIIRPNVVPRRTSAQLVGRSAAERLLAKCQKIERPVDGFLQLLWETQQPIHCVIPSGVTDMTDMVGGTTIQRKDGASPLKKLRRAYHRMAYRAAVLRLSRF
jgi:glycosyl transferase, family 25